MAHKSNPLSGTVKDDDVWRLQKQVKELRDHLQARGLIAKGAVMDKMHEVGESLHQYYDEGRDRMEDVEGELTEFVRTKPLQALLAAIGVGYLLSVIFRRR
jgi:ElaB/YqjD/DUF883 family membrane-anchored ribosome-binding protein